MSNPGDNGSWSQSNPNDPYGQSEQPSASDPYGQSGHQGDSSASDPWGHPGQTSASDPYGQSSASDPYGQPSASDPYGQPSASDPYGQPQQPAGNQYSQPQQPAGVPAGAHPQGGVPAGQSRMLVGLLGIFLGAYGIHRFLMGYTTIGIIQILVTVVTCGAGSLWGLIEGILILVGAEGFTRDAQGRPLTD